MQKSATAVTPGTSTTLSEISLQVPRSEQGMAVSRLVAACPPLDTNSVYCNLLQCSHFADTSVAAVLDGELVGFVSGYIVPQRPDTLFVWQVAVGEQARGRGLASAMILDILQRDSCRQVRWLETTTTSANGASWKLFRGVASRLDAPLASAEWLERDHHFGGHHDAEFLVRIGPFSP